jgi:hypothetical protein
MRFLRRLWNWMRRRNLESDFAEEAGQHLELKIEENIDRRILLLFLFTKEILFAIQARCAASIILGNRYKR